MQAELIQSRLDSLTPNQRKELLGYLRWFRDALDKIDAINAGNSGPENWAGLANDWRDAIKLMVGIFPAPPWLLQIVDEGTDGLGKLIKEQDPQHWRELSEPRNKAAKEALDSLIRKISRAGGRDRNPQRDRFIYERMKKGDSLKDIKTALETRPTWEVLHTEQAISQAAKRYAKKHGMKWPLR